jgi:uncharacterized protein YjbI with pentapeptide repeats
LQTFAPAASLALADQVVEGGRFEPGVYRFLTLERVELRDCDLSNCVWDHPRLTDVKFSRCRFTGFELREAKGADVVLDSCRGRYVQLVRGELSRAHFRQCELAESTFFEMRLLGAVFAECDLRQSVWSECNLHGADLRGCDTGGIRAAPKDLAGAILDHAQAAQLLRAAHDIRVLEQGEPID